MNHLIQTRILERLLREVNPAQGEPATKDPFVIRELERKIRGFIDEKAPILLVLPAFPAKSPNPEKTLGALPDLGEVLALQKLEDLCRDLEAMWPHGAKLLICSDGRVFSDLVCVPDGAVTDYSLGIRSILHGFEFSHLGTFDLDDVMKERDFDTRRSNLVRDFGVPTEKLRAEVKADPSLLGLFNGIHRFVFEDRAVLEQGKSRNRVREESKEIAYEVIQRSQAWSALVENEFPQAVRLSIHPQRSDSTKIGIRLLPSRDLWRTPWHGVVLRSCEGTRLTTRKEALESGAQLTYLGGKWGYFATDSFLRGVA